MMLKKSIEQLKIIAINTYGITDFNKEIRTSEIQK